MDQPIFVLDDSGNMTRMEPTTYALEDDLQKLIADHPDLLGVNEASELLLVRREHPVPDSDNASGRWSVDHLFVDRNAVPILVEVKRASDTRIRREVVGQMLDYAANASTYWTAEEIRSSFSTTCEAEGIDAEIRLQTFLQNQENQETFWDQVESNLRSGRLRMLFVADQIPRELARIVEFMNEQMEADVLAIEVKPYGGDNSLRTIVPRVIGNTERAIAQKSGSRKKLAPISRDQWIGEHIAPRGEDVEAAFRKTIALVESFGCMVDVTSTQGSLYCTLEDSNGKSVWPFFLNSNGTLQIAFGYAVNRPALTDENVRQKFLAQFENALGPLSTKNISGFPAIDVRKLDDASVLEKFKSVAKEFIEAVLRTDQTV